jgi:hypothetical protein
MHPADIDAAKMSGLGGRVEICLRRAVLCLAASLKPSTATARAFSDVIPAVLILCVAVSPIRRWSEGNGRKDSATTACEGGGGEGQGKSYQEKCISD